MENIYCRISPSLYISMKKQIETQTKELIVLQEKVKRLEYINELLYKDNERLSKIVDTIL